MFNNIRNLTDDVIWRWAQRKFRLYIIEYGVKNIIYWFPIVWQDRWWDHIFLYSILNHKLKQMEKGFREDGCHVYHEQDAKKIKICVLLLDRLQNDAYIDYKNERGWEPELFKFELDKEEHMMNQDLDLLFKILRKHIRTWWD